MKYIKFFNELSMDDVALVGGKNASLGQMIQHLDSVRVPQGFAITVDAFNQVIHDLRDTIDHETGASIRQKIIEAPFPELLTQEIIFAYKKLSRAYNKRNISVAVRSSAPLEDLPTASAAGQQDSFLHIKGPSDLLIAVKKCMASLFNDRAIMYRHQQGITHEGGIAVGVQKMVHADRAVSGVAFSVDTDSGHHDFVTINACFGLGEAVVKGLVVPDEYLVHKPLLALGFKPLVKKVCGNKKQKVFCLSDDQVFEIAHAVVAIENYYSDRSQSWTPMDVEWAYDQYDGNLYIVQARPETVHVHESPESITVYSSPHRPEKALLTGISIGKKISTGSVQVITSPAQMGEFKDGNVLVAPITDPDWVALMARASAVITDQGGRTCHAAIVARELGIPAIIGTHTATTQLRDGQEVTIDCSQGAEGFVYAGAIPFTRKHVELNRKKLPVELMLTIAAADTACQLARLPFDGVGLVRLEFMIARDMGIHPQAIIHPDRVSNAQFKKLSALYTQQYGSLREWYVQKLSQYIGLIAAAFYPRPVIVRLTDFKSNEYRNLLGGSVFEPHEENPMLGFRGACRYLDVQYQEAFKLECQTIARARDVMGLSNIIIMVPFVRTPQEAQETIALLAKNGLRRGSDLQIYQMVEVPSNVVMLEKYTEYFDGFSIGSNDLTQLTLGVDRDSAMLKDLFNEQDPAVKMLIAQTIAKGHAAHKHVGICGQAPSDFPEFAQWLIEHTIDSISLNADAALAWFTD